MIPILINMINYGFNDRDIILIEDLFFGIITIGYCLTYNVLNFTLFLKI